MSKIKLDKLVDVNSSTIKKVGFSGNQTFIEFAKGGVYRYDDTTQNDFDELVKAESVGKHFHSNYKKFDYAKLEGVSLEKNKRTVIGLAGVKTSGKSTVAGIIRNNIGNVNESALADKLKNVSAEVFNVPRNYFDDQDKKEVPLESPRILTLQLITAVVAGFNSLDKITPDIQKKYMELNGMVLDTPRKIAQIVGTEILRLLGSDIHCENVKIHDDGITIISDLRFPNEFEYFTNNPDVNFIPFYLQREVAEAQVGPNSHSSETSVFLFNKKCIGIDNNGSLENTQEQVLKALKERGVL